MNKFKLSFSGIALSFLLSATGVPSAIAHGDANILELNPGEVGLELVGQERSSAPKETVQFGYLSHVHDVEGVFRDEDVQNESTAAFTFYTELKTVRSIDHGPLRIIIREGVTTIYYNRSPSNFSNPDSFRSGVAVQTSSVRQQIVVDTIAQSFTETDTNTVTSVTAFMLDTEEKQFGDEGQIFRSTFYGRLSTAGKPGYFSGQAVSVASAN